MPSLMEFTCTDKFGYHIHCTKKRWEHICEHAEMKYMQKLAINSIEDPDFVNRSRSYANRYPFYKLIGFYEFSALHQYLKIVVEYYMLKGHGWRGKVITAFGCDGPPLGEVTVWRR